MKPRPLGPFRYLALLALSLGVVLVSGLSGQNRNAERALRTVLVDGREAIEGEVLVRFRPSPDGFEATRAAGEIQTDEVEAVGRRGARRMRSRRLGTRAMLQALRANPDVEYAEPNYVIRLATLPNDPYMFYLWGLFNAGQDIFGTPGVVGADSGAHYAWDIATGSRANVVGVIDTGIDYTHPDLAANLWTAPRPFSVVIGGIAINCAAGTHGFNAITNTCNPMDDQSHGTHVAGTIGAVGMNGTGIAGMNWVASMMGLKFLDSSGSGSTSDAIKAIEFAIQAKAVLGADANVRILSNSWGGGGFSASLANQIEAANTANMLFVAAAGNGGSDGIGDNNDAAPFYPASYANANVVSVASMTSRDQRSSFSNYGAGSVDLGAPGSEILSTVLGGSYAFSSGTSMATPHVAGAAALLLSGCTLGTTAALKSALLTSVDPVAAMTGLTVTGGRLNVNNAIRTCPPLVNPVPSITSLSPSSAFVLQPLTLTVNGTGFAPGSVVRLDDVSQTTTYVSPTQLTAVISGSDLPVTGARSISVFSPAPGGGTTGTRALTVLAGPTLTVNGSAGAITVAPNAGMVVMVGGGPGSATDWITIAPVGSSGTTYSGIWFLSGTPIPPAVGLSNASIVVPAPATEGTYEVRFLSNGRYQRLATSAAVSVVAPRPAPQLFALSPPAAVQGRPGLDVLITGTGFHATSQVRFDGVARPTTFNGVGMLTVALPASDLASVAAHTITVHTPAPGGGTSAGATFSVTPMPVNPRLTSLSPSSIGAGATSLTLAVTGTDFAFNSFVVVDGASRPTSYLSSTALTATLPASDLATPGTRSILVITPAPGGGGSEMRSLAVLGPAITVNGSAGAVSVAPGVAMTIAVANGPANATDWITIAPVGSSATTYNGIWFLNGRSTPPVSGLSNTTLVIPAPASNGAYEVRLLANGRYSRLATSGVVNVATPNPAPQVSAIAPAAVAAGTSGVSLVVSGSGFIAASEVRFDGAARATTFNHAGMLTASLTAADLAAVAAHTITVVTPSPGGGTSTGAAFNVIAPPPVPVLTAISPAAVGAGAAFVITATGTDFATTSQIHVDGVARPTTYLSSTQLTAAIPASDVPGPGSRSITVFAPAPGGGTSAARVLSIIGPGITVNGSAGAVSVAPGAAMTVAVANGPASVYDWVTIAPVGSSSTTHTGVWFLSGTSTPPASGLSHATLVLPSPASAGRYEVRFLASGRYGRLATSGEVTVVAQPTPSPPAPTGPSLTVNGSTGPLSVARGAALTIAIADGPANIFDWVTIAPVGSSATTYTGIWFLNGTSVSPPAGLSRATFAVPAPTVPGTYEVRFLGSGRYTRLATSDVVTVTP